MKKHILNQIADYDLKLLRLFKTVVDAGSFTAAEGLLGISKSAISIQMSDLEKRLGMRLCHRGRGGFSLTNEGSEVLRAIEVLLAAVEEFRTEVNQINKELRGDLNIGIVNNLVTQPEMRITTALKKLKALGSGVCINISMSTPAEIERGLVDGRLHVGVIPMHNTLSGLNYQYLYQERFQLYCSHEHELFDQGQDLHSQDLANYDAIIPSYRMTSTAIDQHQLLNCTASASDREGIAFLILTGSYIGFLPSHFAETWVQQHKMKVLLEDTLFHKNELAVVTRSGIRASHILESFLGFLS
jgi:DNA-binding transcriptional LysR family regulator